MRHPRTASSKPSATHNYLHRPMNFPATVLSSKNERLAASALGIGGASDQKPSELFKALRFRLSKTLGHIKSAYMSMFWNYLLSGSQT